MGNIRARDRLEGLELDGRKILKCHKEVGWSLDWIDLAQDRDRRLVLLSAVMNLPVPQNVGKFLIS